MNPYQSIEEGEATNLAQYFIKMKIGIWQEQEKKFLQHGKNQFLKLGSSKDKTNGEDVVEASS